jgi:hypothetical protein
MLPWHRFSHIELGLKINILGSLGIAPAEPAPTELDGAGWAKVRTNQVCFQKTLQGDEKFPQIGIRAINQHRSTKWVNLPCTPFGPSKPFFQGLPFLALIGWSLAEPAHLFDVLHEVAVLAEFGCSLVEGIFNGGINGPR